MLTADSPLHLLCRKIKIGNIFNKPPQKGGFFLKLIVCHSKINYFLWQRSTFPPATPGGARRSGKKGSKTVDLAPMVDLGLILLSFFVFTAALTQTMAMKLTVPNDKNSSITDDICEIACSPFYLERIIRSGSMKAKALIQWKS